MKATIVSLLKKRFPEFVSGEELSEILGISRTAVWKHVQQLREGGYEIESHPKVGYRMLRSPDKMYEHELAVVLRGKILGTKIVYREQVGSTNELAKELARQGAPEGTVVIAEAQTAGKGRLGRHWHSPEGRGLWFSLILRPEINPADAAKTTLVTAVGVAKAIRKVTGAAAGIKWPNDILLDDRKVAGILTEINAEVDRIHYLIVGIGINTNLQPESIPEISAIATSLSKHQDTGFSRIQLFAEVLHSLDDLYGRFVKGDFLAVLQEWKEMSVTLNHWVTVTSLKESDEGLAYDIDSDGALLLKRKDGTIRRVISGEISLRHQG